MTQPAVGKASAPDPRRAVGGRGEQLAIEYLRSVGMESIARNHRTRMGEIDVVAIDAATLAFVEVKTRRLKSGQGRAPDRALPQRDDSGFGDHGLGWPAPAQRLRLRRLALAWLAESRPSGLRAREIRFDAIGVVLSADDQLVSLRHIPGAF